MRKISALVLALVALGLVFAAGSWVGWRSAEGAARSSTEGAVLYYACPMHPAYHSDRQGDCPSCGMRLEPVYADGGDKDAPPDASRLLKVSAERQQTIGVRTGLVEETAGRQTIRTVGRLVADETRLYPIFAATDGWIQEVSDTSTGSMVRKGQRLGSYYSPELVPALQRYFLTVPGYDAGPRTYTSAGNVQAIIQQATDLLRSLGMTETQIEEVNRTKALHKEIWILSPAPGFVLARNISTGQRFEKGAELYRIADLSRVWILADVFESEADFVTPGSVAQVVVPQLRRQYQARISNVEPLFDETTRTLKVRLELDNPGFALKPGMFADVNVPVALPPALTVPSDAVLDSGLRKLVFVDRGNGYFEPRRVETGWRMGDRVEIIKGLMAGERIVVSGNFLLDSENRMKIAASGVFAPETDPVCGMDVDRDKATAAGRTVTHDGSTYYFCSDECVKKFQADPAKYMSVETMPAATADHDHAQPAAKPPAQPPMAMPKPGKTDASAAPRPDAAPGMPMNMPPAAAGADPATDPVCGMAVEKKDAQAAGRTSTHAGTTYYFCSDDCKQKFDAEPGRWVKK